MKRVFPPSALLLGTAFCLLACLSTSACGSDGPPTTDDDEQPAEGSSKRDAGASSTKRDAGASSTKRDAGKPKDAEAEPADEDEPEDEDDSASVDDEDNSEDQDNEPPAKDAGVVGKVDAGKPSSTDAGASGPASCSELTYASFGEMFLKTYCYECHSAKVGMPLGGIVLDTPAGIMKTISTLKKVVIPRADGKEPAMPKGGNDDLTDAERIKFGQWIDCGAK